GQHDAVYAGAAAVSAVRIGHVCAEQWRPELQRDDAGGATQGGAVHFRRALDVGIELPFDLESPGSLRPVAVESRSQYVPPSGGVYLHLASADRSRPCFARQCPGGRQPCSGRMAALLDRLPGDRAVLLSQLLRLGPVRYEHGGWTAR